MRKEDFRLSFYNAYQDKKSWFEGQPIDHYDEAHQIEFDRLKMHTPCKILEVGFGNAGFMFWASSKGHDVEGIEINENLVKLAEDKGLRVHAGDGLEVMKKLLGNNSYDLIVMLDVLEHHYMDEILEIVGVAEQLLNPDGKMMLRFPNGQSPFGSFHQYGDATHITFLSGPILKDVASVVGLEYIATLNSARTLSGGKRRGVKYLKKVAYLFRSTIELALGFIYFGRRIPLDPSVTVILGKKSPVSG